MQRRLTRFISFFIILSLQFLIYLHFPTFLQSQTSSNSSKIHREQPEEDYADKIVLWSSDYHISPINDVKDLMRMFPKVRVIDESLSKSCKFMNTCSKGLKVKLPLGLTDCRNKVKREFYDAYKNDSRMQSVSAFLCQHAFTLCEAFMAFGKPLIMIASTRYEIGRWKKIHWDKLNMNLELIVSKEYNFVGANNEYDRKYMEHFTALSVQYLPNFCGYVKTVYSGTINKFILGPNHRTRKAKLIMDDVKYILRKKDIPFTDNRNLEGKDDYYGLYSKHKGLIFIPYQVSLMSFFEAYKMAMPIFAPSLKLLVKWQKRNLMPQISWNCVKWVKNRKCKSGSVIDAKDSAPDPNLIYNMTSMGHWLAYSDYYNEQYPHIQYFDSLEDLSNQLQSADLNLIHQKMLKQNKKRLKMIGAKWKGILDRIPSKPAKTFDTWDEAMKYYYPGSPDIDQEC